MKKTPIKDELSKIKAEETIFPRNSQKKYEELLRRGFDGDKSYDVVFNGAEE